MESKIPVPDPEARYALLLRALQLLNSQGITSVQDAGSSDPAEDAPLYARAKQYGRLSVRLSIATNMKEGDVERPIAQAQSLRTQSADHLLRFGTIKGFVDGVIEAKTAAVLEPYPEGGAGLPNWRPETLQAAVVAADKAGLQVYLHAIGDRGVRMALDAHEARRQGERSPRPPRPHRAHRDDLRRRPAALCRARRDRRRCSRSTPTPTRTSSTSGRRTPVPTARAAASAGRPSSGRARASPSAATGPSSPPTCSAASTARSRARRARARPPGGWHPEQAVTLESALRHYTIDAAYASFEEGVKGSLAPGKLADLVVLADDIFKAPPETILKTRVLLTLLGGRVVYQAD